MVKPRILLIELRSSLWFLPTLIVLASGVLAVVFIELDARLTLKLLANFPRLFGAGAEGSRGMLTSIASSMITVAGVTFSITIVALSQASSQYSSRILRNFMRDRGNQAVLGVFLGIFTYCLLVLRAIRGGDENEFVPSLSVFGALILALVGIGFLIFFIHHAASLLQASNVIAAAAHETFQTIDRLFPESLHDDGSASPSDPESNNWLEQEQKILIPAPKTGYIQSHDEKAFFHLACSSQSVFRMHVGVGEFAAFDSPLLTVYSKSSRSEKLVKSIQATYGISSVRTIEQDAGFGIRQIVDIALKALSPGVNDTTTAITCIDYLTAINLRLANRRIAQPLTFENGRLRVIAKGPSFEQFFGESFDEIRASAAGKATVILRLLHSLKTIGAATEDRARRLLIFRQISLLEDLTTKTIDSDYDVLRIRRAVHGVDSQYSIDSVLREAEPDKEEKA
jgi:uncharacterized membrane protein